jgi:hypothetical protein
LCVPSEKRANYTGNDVGVKIVIEPYPNMKLAQKRGWIVHEWLKYGHEKILMLDDDLTFRTA